MPWLETSLMDQRMQFIADVQRDLWPVTELAQRFGISRKTAYKWIERYEDAGPTGLTDRSRRPQHCPHETPQAGRRGGARGPSTPSPVGSQEASPHSHAERSSRDLAGPQHRL